jgi:hypothetical protein
MGEKYCRTNDNAKCTKQTHHHDQRDAKQEKTGTAWCAIIDYSPFGTFEATLEAPGLIFERIVLTSTYHHHHVRVIRRLRKGKTFRLQFMLTPRAEKALLRDTCLAHTVYLWLDYPWFTTWVWIVCILLFPGTNVSSNPSHLRIMMDRPISIHSFLDTEKLRIPNK